MLLLLCLASFGHSSGSEVNCRFFSFSFLFPVGFTLFTLILTVQVCLNFCLPELAFKG